MSKVLEDIRNVMSLDGHLPILSNSNISESEQFGRASQSMAPKSSAIRTESDSTLAVFSEMASGIVQSAVTNDPATETNDELRGHLHSLDRIVEALKSPASPNTSYPQAQELVQPSFQKSRLPPIEQVVAILRDPKSM